MQRIAHFEVLGPIGAGGMGEVFRARDTRLNRLVAIKVLPEAFASDRDRLHRFEREARTLAALDHPNILVVFDVGQQDGRPYLVTELLEGRNLREELQPGPLPLRSILKYALEIARGLSAAHARGIIHRDLKPENLFVTREGRVKVLDFGIAKLVEEARAETGTAAGGKRVDEEATTRPDGDTTRPGRVLGTPSYMSPEQVRGEMVDPRTDLFSLGCILHEMASGQRPFRRNTDADTMAAILREEPPELTISRPDAPTAFARIVERCLQKAPEQRFQSAADLAFALESLTESGSAAATARPVGGSRDPGRLRWVAAGVVAGLAIGALATLGIARSTGARQNAGAPGGVGSVQRTITHLASPPGAAFDEFGSIAISPDGRWVAAVAGLSLWVRDLSSTSWKRIPGTETATFPFWSPNGDSIAFSSEERRALLVVPRTGATPPVKICDSAMNGVGSWHSNGAILFNAGPTNRIEMTRLGWGRSEIVTRAAPGESVHMCPQFLPDGQRFVFVVVRPGEAKATVDLCLATIGDATRHQTLLKDVSNVQLVGPDRVVFVRQGVLWQQRVDFDAGNAIGKPELIPTEPIRYSRVDGLAEFAFATNGVMIHLEKTFRKSRLLRVDRSGQPVGEPLVADPTHLRAARTSPDGKHVGLAIFDATTQDEDIWVIDTPSGQRRRLTHDAAPSQLGYLNLAWMPDSAELVYMTSIRGPSELRFIPLRGGTPSHASIVAQDSFALTPHQNLPDRTAMLGRFDPKTRSDIITMRLDGSDAVTVKVASPWWDDCPRATADGKWMIYISNDEDPKESSAWLARSSSPGERMKLRLSNPIQVEWGAGGAEVLALAGGAVWSVPIQDLDSGKPVPGTPARLFSWPWATPALSSFQTIEAVFDIFPDGQHFLMSVPAEELSPTRITVIHGWEAPAGMP